MTAHEHPQTGGSFTVQPDGALKRNVEDQGGDAAKKPADKPAAPAAKHKAKE